MENFIALMIS